MDRPSIPCCVFPFSQLHQTRRGANLILPATSLAHDSSLQLPLSVTTCSKSGVPSHGMGRTSSQGEKAFQARTSSG